MSVNPVNVVTEEGKSDQDAIPLLSDINILPNPSLPSVNVSPQVAIPLINDFIPPHIWLPVVTKPAATVVAPDKTASSPPLLIMVIVVVVPDTLKLTSSRNPHSFAQ